MAIARYIAPMREFEWIARYLAPLAGEAGLGLKDDAACWQPPVGNSLVMTKDAMVAGVHFLPDDPPDHLAQKLLRVNLSDLAAKGAQPQGYLLALSLPEGTDEGWIEAFCRGLARDQQNFTIRLWGGDTTRTPGPLTLCLTAIGTVTAGAMVPRHGAQPGDRVYMTGTLGDAALWLASHQGRLGVKAPHNLAALQPRYQLPTPQLAVGQGLGGIASAALDISDGLLADAHHLAEASAVQMCLQRPWLPLSAEAAQAVAQQPDAAWPVILAGGDDYELLFTAPADKDEAIRKLSQQTGVAIHRIGEICQGQGVEIRDESGAKLDYALKGWQHF
jgi:thiamine-monophosphate kinase